MCRAMSTKPSLPGHPAKRTNRCAMTAAVIPADTPALAAPRKNGCSSIQRPTPATPDDRGAQGFPETTPGSASPLKNAPRERIYRLEPQVGPSSRLGSAYKQQCLYFLPLPHGQGSFRPGLG